MIGVRYALDKRRLALDQERPARTTRVILGESDAGVPRPQSRFVITKPIRPPIRTSRLERIAGSSLFLVVTACWMFVFADDKLGWIGFEGYVLLIAWGLSAVSLVMTGYVLGRLVNALWFVWVPGAAMTALGIWMNPTPGTDEPGGALIFLGPIVAVSGWVYFLPLIALGVWLRRRRETAHPGSPRLPLLQP